jgi:DNA-binding transcriptional ArsR family regulator
MKLTKNQINLIKEKHKSGIKLRELAKEFKVSHSTIDYHLNKERRYAQIKKSFDKKPIEERRAIWRKKGKYINNWIKNKYKIDESFRNKIKERSKNYYTRNNKSKK